MRNEQFENDIKVVPALFNTLCVGKDGGESTLKGQLPIIDASGKLWETFQIEIKGSDCYPYSFPKLFETADAFPHNADWHVYENDFSCCIDVPMNEKILCKKGLHLSDFIKGYAIPYFANQIFRIKEGYYRHGEYAHGIFGRIQYYQKKLKPNSLAQLLEMFSLILSSYNPDRAAYCPFCYKVKFRHCHRDTFKELQLIKEYLFYDGSQLFSFFTAHPDYKLPI